MASSQSKKRGRAEIYTYAPPASTWKPNLLAHKLLSDEGIKSNLRIYDFHDLHYYHFGLTHV